MLAEGIRLIEEALDAGLETELSLVAPGLLGSERGRRLARRLGRSSRESLECSDRVLERAGSLESSQGVLAAFPRPSWTDADFFRDARPFLVVAARVQDPGNLGAILRCAEAASASGVLALEGSADPFRDKALRGSAGSAFRLPCRGGVDPGDLLELLGRQGCSLVGTDPGDGTPLWDFDFGEAPLALLVGSEGAGISERLRKACRGFLRIPMAPPVESLNVAVATGLVLFERGRRLGRQILPGNGS